MSLINEVARAVIALPPDATIYSSTVYLAVAFDASGAQVNPTLLTRGSSKSLGYLAGYELIGYLLCGDRAQRTVDRSLVVGGKEVTPEAYLALWRTAVDGAYSPGAFKARHGLSLIATICGPVDRMSQYRSSWTSAPFKSFARTRHAENLEVSGGRFQLRLDLAEPNAARDAYYIAEMVGSACRDDDTLWSASVTLEGHQQSVLQTELFGTSLAEAVV